MKKEYKSLGNELIIVFAVLALLISPFLIQVSDKIANRFDRAFFFAMNYFVWFFIAFFIVVFAFRYFFQILDNAKMYSSIENKMFNYIAIAIIIIYIPIYIISVFQAGDKTFSAYIGIFALPALMSTLSIALGDKYIMTGTVIIRLDSIVYCRVFNQRGSKLITIETKGRRKFNMKLSDRYANRLIEELQGKLNCEIIK